MAAPESEMLAPEPDFRYVGLAPGVLGGGRAWRTSMAGGLLLSAGLADACGLRFALAGGLLASAIAVLPSFVRRAPSARRFGARPVKMAIVPWGVLVDDDQPRVLRWAGVRGVHVEMQHARDGATDSTLSSLIVVHTDRERFAARAPGAVALERLLVHLDAYAREASHVVALDLDGSQAGEGHDEAECESLLHAVRAYVDSATGSERLSLAPGHYRRVTARAPTDRTISELRGVLLDRRSRRLDPRPFAILLAAELGARSLVGEIVPLVQSPHPVVAAVARVAAGRLGVPVARVGSLDEVAPFLLPADVDVLTRWAAAA